MLKPRKDEIVSASGDFLIREFLVKSYNDETAFMLCARDYLPIETFELWKPEVFLSTLPAAIKCFT